MIALEDLKEYLVYNPKLGTWTWIKRTTDVSYRIEVGTQAGSIDIRGYRVIRIFLREYKASRLAWFWMTGKWPEKFIDHRNGIRDDDRWENLREATNTENCRNAKLSKRNSTGYKGVTFDPKSGRYRARIMVDRKSKHVGWYYSPEAAYEAYCNAAKEHHKDFARTA